MIVAKYKPSEHVRRRLTNPKKTSSVLAVGHFGKITEPMRQYFPPIRGFTGKTMLRLGVNGRGTCFYHTIRSVVDPKVYIEASADEQLRMGRQFRLDLAERVDDTWVDFWLSKKWPRSKIPPVADTKRALADFTEWADIFTIIWTVQCILDLNIIVFDVQHGQLYCGTHRMGSTRPTILMAWIKQSHFEPIVQYDKDKKTIRTLFNHDHPTLLAVLRMYEQSQCPKTSLHQLLSRRRRRYGGAAEVDSIGSFPFA